jgi:hypothetical protein
MHWLIAELEEKWPGLDSLAVFIEASGRTVISAELLK